MLLISHLKDAKVGASAADVGRAFHLKLVLCGGGCFLEGGGGGGSFEAVCSGGNLFKF